MAFSPDGRYWLLTRSVGQEKGDFATVPYLLDRTTGTSGRAPPPTLVASPPGPVRASSSTGRPIWTSRFGQFADGLATQMLTTDAQGNLARWEFWELTSAATRKLNVRLKVNGGTKQTIPINQVASGPFGYVTIEQALGYSDGLHAGVFNKGGAVDTAVRILPNADTTVTLPAGSYTLDVRTDGESPLTGVAVTITAGQTSSLTAEQADLLAAWAAALKH